jgi:hypothetical protein
MIYIYNMYSPFSNICIKNHFFYTKIPIKPTIYVPLTFNAPSPMVGKLLWNSSSFPPTCCMTLLAAFKAGPVQEAKKTCI